MIKRILNEAYLQSVNSGYGGFTYSHVEFVSSTIVGSRYMHQFLHLRFKQQTLCSPSGFLNFGQSQSAQVLLPYLKPTSSAELRASLQRGTTYISDFKHPRELSTFTSTHLHLSCCSGHACSTTICRPSATILRLISSKCHQQQMKSNSVSWFPASVGQTMARYWTLNLTPHGTHNWLFPQVDFTEVAKECQVVSKGAA